LSPFPHVRADERADRDDAQILRMSAFEREFNERIAEMPAAKFLRHTIIPA